MCRVAPYSRQCWRAGLVGTARLRCYSVRGRNGAAASVARMERSVIRDRPSPDYAEFIIGGPAEGRTRWLHPGYMSASAPTRRRLPMKELIRQYLDEGMSRRQLMTGLSALG